jgi:hypothetical protein
MEMLEEQLAQKGPEQQHASQRIKEALAACRPLWQAEIGVVGYDFSDMIIVGTPDSETLKATGQLEVELDKARASLNEDTRYQAETDRVTTHDPHRIYAVRLSHGGRPHYLVSWNDYKQAYHEWRERQAHPIHVFSQRHVAKMPAMEPIEPGSEVDLDFALALAYGVIAKRGDFYYFNLETRTNGGLLSYEAPINSQLDCITFRNTAPREEPGSVNILAQRDRFRFGRRDEGDPERALGQGRADALQTFNRSTTRPKIVHEFFDVLRNLAGDDQISRELETYMDDVAERTSVKHRHYGQVMREMELLRQQIGQLKNGG